MKAGLLLGAGRSRRFEGDRLKQLVRPGKKPVLVHTLDRWDELPFIDAYLLVGPTGYLEELHDVGDLDSRGSCLDVVAGGESRRDSVCLGLQTLRQYNPEQVFVHDSARPLVPDEIYDRLSNRYESTEFKGIVPALKPMDTIKRVHGSNRAQVKETLDRSELRRIQTPQLFDFRTLLEVHKNWSLDRSATDDAMMLELEGYTVGLVEGSRRGRKITYRTDLDLLETMMERERN